MSREIDGIRELVDERIDACAKKSVKRYGKRSVMRAVVIFEELGSSLYGSTAGFYSNIKPDWEIIKMTEVLKQFTTSLKNAAERK